jgi:hypothetical protein
MSAYERISGLLSGAQLNLVTDVDQMVDKREVEGGQGLRLS